MPPVSISTAGRQRRCRSNSRNSFESWATPQAIKPQVSELLSKNSRSTAWEGVASIIGRGW